MQYTIAAARATLDKNNNDFLQTKLLQGNFRCFTCLSLVRKEYGIFNSLMAQLNCYAGLDITILGCNDFYSYRNYVSSLSVLSYLFIYF